MADNITAFIIRINIVALVVIFGMLQHSPAVSAPSNASCLMCHSASTFTKVFEDEEIPIHVNPSEFSTSVHGKLSCVECHVDLKNEPLMHKPTVDPVQCIQCHETDGWHADGIHRNIGAKDNPPACQDCHGSHYIRPKTDISSAVNPMNSESTCTKCHSDASMFAPFLRSVHAAASDRSGRRNANCTDCHQAHSEHTSYQPFSCAQCHEPEFNSYMQSTHGTALKKGSKHVPTCVTCHGGHDIYPAENPASNTHFWKISDSCSQCHEDHDLMKAHNLPSDRLKSYDHSFHGIAMRFGSTTTATCVSCHRAHDIRSSGDPLSSTHANNLPDTCGECHTGTNENWAIGAQHVVISSENKDVLFYVANGFKFLTMGVMTALIGHIMLDLYSQIRGLRRRQRGIDR